MCTFLFSPECLSCSAILLCLTVISLILVSFIPYKDNALPGQLYKPDITNGLICMFYFLILLPVRRSGEAALREIDYYTIVLLVGLFIIIGGVSEAGIIDLIGETISGLNASGERNSVFLVYTVIVWMSALLSAFIDNIPFVAVITERMTVVGGLPIHPNLLYFGLLVGATLGGNLTPIGASANIAGIGVLRKEGYEVKTTTSLKFGVPFTLAAVMAGYLLVWFIWM